MWSIVKALLRGFREHEQKSSNASLERIGKYRLRRVLISIFCFSVKTFFARGMGLLELLQRGIASSSMPKPFQLGVGPEPYCHYGCT